MSTWRRRSFQKLTSRGQCFEFTWLLISTFNMLGRLAVETISIGLESRFALISLGNGIGDASSARLAVHGACLRFPVALDMAALYA